MARVSVIVVNYNGRGLIKGCLNALMRQSFRNFEAIIVDNGSSDHSISEIREFLRESASQPFARLIPLSSNLGFAGGNIEGFRYAEGEYIALLNNDAEPEDKWLEALVAAMESDPQVGICASKLVVHGTNIIDSAGDEFSAVLKGFKRGEGEKTSLYGMGKYIFGACAGAALYRRKMIAEIGFLDEDFFLIHEDTDLNLRAHLYGWKALYVPEAVVYHKVRASIKKMSEKAIYYTLRNSDFVIIKDIPLGILLRNFIAFLARTILDFFYFAVKHRNWKLYFRAKIDVLKMMPKMLRKREIIMKTRKAKNQQLLRIMTPACKIDFIKSKAKKLFYETPQ